MEILGIEPRTLRLKDKYSIQLSYTSLNIIKYFVYFIFTTNNKTVNGILL